MEVLQRTQGLPVIITSAYDQYAIDSYNLNVTDYLLKPYTLDRLKSAIDKGKKIIRLNQLDEQDKGLLITIRVDGSTEKFNSSEILYFESLKDYVKVVMTNNRTRLTLGRLNGFEEQLSNVSFIRVHRSYLINSQKIASQSAASFIMADGKEIPIGRKYKQNLYI